MPKAALVEIREAEKKAEEIVERAGADSGELIAKTREQLAQKRAGAIEKAEKEGEALAEKERKKAEHSADATVKKESKKIKDAEQKAAKNVPKGIELVVRRILGED